MPVTEARRAFLALEWREAKAEDPTVKTVHLLAVQSDEDSLLQVAADAQAESNRRQTLRGILRNAYDCVVPLNDSVFGTLDLGDVVTLQHTRYGLSAGAKYRVIGVEPDARNNRVTLRLWGPADPVSLMRITPVVAGTGTTT
jgi:hypothetical protein